MGAPVHAPLPPDQGGAEVLWALQAAIAVKWIEMRRGIGSHGARGRGVLEEKADLAGEEEPRLVCVPQVGPRLGQGKEGRRDGKARGGGGLEDVGLLAGLHVPGIVEVLEQVAVHRAAAIPIHPHSPLQGN